MSKQSLRLACPLLCLLALVARGGAASHPAGKPNRLSRETSPYLLLHAHNPVDWYPWGSEALERARREKKLIFLSIGYSSCHWCHVMERESFMDPEVAAYLNEHFVCIKVDREERPDLDEIYMTSLQYYHRLVGSSQSGGWPLTVLLTPDVKPFFGATYLPPRNSEDQVGLLTILKQVSEIWRDEPQKLQSGADQLTDIVRRALRERALAGGSLPDVSLADQIETELASEFDPEFGGFGYAEFDVQRPKFPDHSNLAFLLDRLERAREAGTSEEKLLLLLDTTLTAMATGGIRDHLGGGFHRYSTDRFWRIPHFEKMLYDNGQLASIYAQAFALTGNELYRTVVTELLAMVERDFLSPEGAFYAALDAESEGREGGYHAWKKADLEAALSAEEFAAFAPVYGLTRSPNFEDDLYVLLLAQSPAEVASQLGIDEAELQSRLTTAREKLLALRHERPQPLTDTKILTDWNGLMIAGFADAGRVLDRDEYLATAKRAAEFVLAKLRGDDGRLAHVYAGGSAKAGAYLDDYTNLVAGLIALHRATGDARWLDEADALTRKQIELFWDTETGGFYFTSGDHEDLLARSKRGVDSATPAGNGVAALNLIALAQLRDQPDYLDYARKTIAAFGGLAERAPSAVTTLARARLELAHEPDEKIEE
ncbi:MAG: thioredoxin domain-containing protein [Pirellulales bacterium]|nr:thioredoxin domain-containing protein [Pirellulales bacterium]